MSYRVGGIDGPPRLICDGCGASRSVTNAHDQPFAWFLNRKKAPGWAMSRPKGELRRDLCGDCLTFPGDNDDAKDGGR